MQYTGKQAKTAANLSIFPQNKQTDRGQKAYSFVSLCTIFTQHTDRPRPAVANLSVTFSIDLFSNQPVLGIYLVYRQTGQKQKAFQ